MNADAKPYLRTLFGSILLLASLVTPAEAAPLPVMQPGVHAGIIQPEPIRYRGRRYARRSGVPAAALGVLALGTAAAIASSRRHRGCGYYGDCGYYGGGYYGRRAYGRGVYGGYGYRGPAYYRGGSYRGGYGGGFHGGAGVGPGGRNFYDGKR